MVLLDWVARIRHCNQRATVDCSLFVWPALRCEMFDVRPTESAGTAVVVVVVGAVTHPVTPKGHSWNSTQPSPF